MKVSFLICTNNETDLKECSFYINRLYIPENTDIEIHSLAGARSMSAGYNELTRKYGGDINVYLHQDVYIINRNFIYDIERIFDSDNNIGLIGMVGYKYMTDIAVMWKSHYRCGEVPLYGAAGEYEESDINAYRYDLEKDGVFDTPIADGFLLAANKDLPWDEESYSGWDFYDADQCMRYLEAGYRVVTPYQRLPWCIHDDGIVLTLFNYNVSRKVFLNKWSDFAEKRNLVERVEDGLRIPTLAYIELCERERDFNARKLKSLRNIFGTAVTEGSFNELKKLEAEMSEPGFVRAGESERMIRMITAFNDLKGVSGYEEFSDKYETLIHSLRRLEILEDKENEALSEAVLFILQNKITPGTFAEVLKNELFEKRCCIALRFCSLLKDTVNDSERLKWLMSLAENYPSDALLIETAALLMDYNEFEAALEFLQRIKAPTEKIKEITEELKAALGA